MDHELIFPATFSVTNIPFLKFTGEWQTVYIPAFPNPAFQRVVVRYVKDDENRDGTHMKLKVSVQQGRYRLCYEREAAEAFVAFLDANTLTLEIADATLELPI
jgi:hypothetical protein